ncbi:S-layer homology domain-containing protein [Paenibacillus hemerocallicola]|uniref:S-layer homology domain-containing protein n=1 Tax=Paenibacillus hemerocallicola TaxID=1172614 RepID=A0A5C4T0R3_9BACL|nr:S-layer homology domain-containing protein [Paenibacillus hemerocallicola]
MIPCDRKYLGDPGRTRYGKTHTALGLGLLEGREGNQFVPDGLATRAEAAVALLRLWKVLQ